MTESPSFGWQCSPPIQRLPAGADFSRISIHLPHAERIAKLDAHERTTRPSTAVITALQHWLTEGKINWHPDPDAVHLRTALADYTGLPFGFIRVFNGARDALHQLSRTFIDQQDEILTVPPVDDSFTRAAAGCGGIIKKIIAKNIFAPDLPTITDAIRPSSKLLYLANPNQLTGVLYSPAQIKTILRDHPGLGLIIDESLYEYTQMTVADLVPTHPMLIIVRSFSPAFGLAGMRLGYLLSQGENLTALDRLAPDAAASSPAQIAGVAALTAREETAEYVTQVLNNTTILRDNLDAMGLPVIATTAGFILVKVAQPQIAAEYLAEKLIFVYNCEALPGLEGYLRITVGDEQTTRQLLAALLRMPPTIRGSRLPRRLQLSRPGEKTFSQSAEQLLNSSRVTHRASACIKE